MEPGMTTTVEDRTVLITGANRGIGKALVQEALARGARRVHAGTRGAPVDPDPRVTPVRLDVTNASDIAKASSEIPDLDVLINNAGIMVPDDPFDQTVLERHLAVNVYGSAAVTRAFLPALVRTRGRVINLLSCVALAPLPMFTSYSASKAAAFSLTKTLRAANAVTGVQIHAVLAGPIDTDMTRNLPIPKMSPEAAAHAILAAVDNGEEDVFPDPATAPLREAWAAGPDKFLEHQFAQLVPQAARS